MKSAASEFLSFSVLVLKMWFAVLVLQTEVLFFFKKPERYCRSLLEKSKLTNQSSVTGEFSLSKKVKHFKNINKSLTIQSLKGFWKAFKQFSLISFFSVAIYLIK